MLVKMYAFTNIRVLRCFCNAFEVCRIFPLVKRGALLLVVALVASPSFVVVLTAFCTLVESFSFLVSNGKRRQSFSLAPYSLLISP